MKPEPEDIMERCLDEMRAGKTVEEALTGYPDTADELRPLLLLASELGSLPGPPQTTHGLMRAIAHATIQEVGRAQASERRKVTFFSAPVLVRVAAGLLLLFLFGWGATMASSAAVPGDLMYPVKRITERVKFFLALDDKDQAELRIVFSEQRLVEALKKYERGEGIDENLLRAMLDESKLALDQSMELSDEERGYLISRVGYLTAYQKSVMERLQNQAEPRHQRAIAPYVDMCGRRMIWMKNMMADMGVSPHPWMGCWSDQPSKSAPATSGRGAEADSSRASRGRMERWMDMCPMWGE